MCVLEVQIIDLDFHLIQASATLHVLASALGIRLPPSNLPLAPSNTLDHLNSSSLSSRT